MPGQGVGLPEAGVPPTSSKRFYRPELDGLRFLAFFAVYLNHTLLFGVSGHREGLAGAVESLLGTIGVAGAFGVDLFFGLSAYLITELLLRERAEHGALDVKAFYARRVLRIWPLYFVFLFLARMLAVVVPGEAFSWADFAAFALFSGNWRFILHPVVTVAAPLWSIAVEEQFYILWPWAIRRASLARIASIAAGLVLLGLAIRLGIALSGHNDPWVSKNSFTRNDGIAGGVLLALFLRGRVPALSGLARAALLAGALGVLLLVARFFPLFAENGPAAAIVLGWPLVAAACLAVLVAALGAEGPLGRLLRAPAMVYLGRISYGLYVFHQVGLLVAARLFPNHQHDPRHFAGHFAFGLAVTLALAAASFRWLELPFLALKAKRFSVVASRPDTEPARLASEQAPAIDPADAAAAFESSGG